MEEDNACCVDLSFAEVGYILAAVQMLQSENRKKPSYNDAALKYLYSKMSSMCSALKASGWRWTGDGDSTEFNHDYKPQVLPNSAFKDD